MPHVPGGPGNDGSDTVAYPTDLIRQVAAKILVNTTNAQTAHNNAWNVIQGYLNEGSGTASPQDFDPGGWTSSPEMGPNVRYYLHNVLEPHNKRIQDSFAWQLSMSQALFDMADLIDQTEEKIKESFAPGSNPASTPRPAHGPAPF